MKWARRIAFVAGAVLFVALILRQGVGEIMDAFAVMGWGLAAVAASRIVWLAFNGWGWNLVLDRSRRRPLVTMTALAWIAESINNLLPVARIGGDVVRARLLAREVSPAGYAAGSVVADFTLGLLGQLVFVLAGVALLLAGDTESQATDFVLPLALGGGAVVIFALLQKRGLFDWLARVAARLAGEGRLLGVINGLQSLDEHLRQLYRDRAAVMRCFTVRLIGWFTSVAETWLALYFLGLSPSLGDALILESLSAAARSFAFLLPGALGVQEAVLMLVAAATGLTPEAGLMVSLAKRVREVLLGIPGILYWTTREPRLQPQPD